VICAIDCDLRESFCVTEGGATSRAENPVKAIHDLGNAVAGSLRTILFEIASPVSFNRGAAGFAAMTQLARWALWNMAQAVRLDATFSACTILVSPSNVWTKGYDLKTRHAMAKCKQPKKDLRECEAMIFMYKHNPAVWKSLPEYLASL